MRPRWAVRPDRYAKMKTASINAGADGRETFRPAVFGYSSVFLCRRVKGKRRLRLHKRLYRNSNYMHMRRYAVTKCKGNSNVSPRKATRGTVIEKTWNCGRVSVRDAICFVLCSALLAKNKAVEIIKKKDFSCNLPWRVDIIYYYIAYYT